jgi:hypothetical protein
MSERTPDRQAVADEIERLRAAIEHERTLTQALERAGQIEQQAADAVAETQHAGEAFAARVKEAAMAGAAAPTSIPDEIRREALARSRLTAASCALAEIAADLEAAKSASLEASRSLDRATSRVLQTHAEQLIAEALEAQQRVERIRLELYAIDRTGGVPGFNGVHVPFAFPASGVALVRDLASRSPAALGASGVNITPTLERWSSYRSALRDDPDAEIAQA